MWKLIRLEWEKHDSKKYVRNAVIVALVLGVFLFAQCFLGIANDPETGVPDAATEAVNNISSQIELLSGACFLVFAGVMSATFLVGAYKDRIVNVMFTYPIKRQKLLVAGMLAVWIFNVVALIITKLFLYSMLAVTAQFKTADFPMDYSMTDPSLYVGIIMNSMVLVTISFIGLFVGKLFHSTKMTVIMSFVLFFLLNGTIGDYSVAGNAMVQGVLVVVSLLCAVGFLVGIEKRDVL